VAVQIGSAPGWNGLGWGHDDEVVLVPAHWPQAEMMMRIVIVGAGAVGGFIGGRLALAGKEVVLVGRPPLEQAVRTRGFRLVEPNGTRHTGQGLTAVASVAEAVRSGPFDLALLTVRTYDVRDAALEMDKSGLKGIPVLCVQNGVGSEDEAIEVFGQQRVVVGSLTLPVTVPQPGVVRLVRERGGLGLATAAVGADPGAVVAAFMGSGLRVRTYPDFRSLRWSKLPLNLLGNSISAVLDMGPSDIYAHPGLVDLEVSALREVRSVCNRLGVRLVDLPGYPVRALMWLVCRAPTAGNAALLKWSVAAGRRGRVASLRAGLKDGRLTSEVGHMNGAVVRWGGHLGIPTPANRLLWEVLVELFSQKQQWTHWAGRPERLAAEWTRAKTLA
jgi:2-dehydropantoate 2-reductase